MGNKTARLGGYRKRICLGPRGGKGNVYSDFRLAKTRHCFGEGKEALLLYESKLGKTEERE